LHIQKCIKAALGFIWLLVHFLWYNDVVSRSAKVSGFETIPERGIAGLLRRNQAARGHKKSTLWWVLFAIQLALSRRVCQRKLTHRGSFGEFVKTYDAHP
jgi:hypothetical protein